MQFFIDKFSSNSECEYYNWYFICLYFEGSKIAIWTQNKKYYYVGLEYKIGDKGITQFYSLEW